MACTLRSPRAAPRHRPHQRAVLLVAALAAACGKDELDRNEAKRIVAEHVRSLGPAAAITIPLAELLEPGEQLRPGPNEDLDFLVAVPATTPPHRWATKCSSFIQDHGRNVFRVSEVEAGGSSMNFKTGAFSTWTDRVRLLLLEPIAPEVLEITGIVPHPLMASARVVEYTWGYPIPRSATAIRCRVHRSRPSPVDVIDADTYDVLWKQPDVSPRKGEVTLSRYDDGWRVTQ